MGRTTKVSALQAKRSVGTTDWSQLKTRSYMVWFGRARAHSAFWPG